MPEITDDIDDARAKLVNEIETVDEANARRMLLPSVRMIIKIAETHGATVALDKVWQDMRDRTREESAFHGDLGGKR